MIGLTVGLILAAILCVAIILLVIYLVKRKKPKTEQAPDVPETHHTTDDAEV